MLNSIKEIHVKNWNELISTLHSNNIVQHQPYEGNHYRSPYLFRGMDDARWELQTSLERLPRQQTANTRLLESSLIRSFRKYANAGAFDEKSEWYVLAVAQHNGLPTRCLDWTSSPLVATHFACGNEVHKNSDGAIWCLHSGILRDINIDNNTKQKNLTGVAWLYDTRLLEKDYQTINELDATHIDGDMMLLWEPPSLDARIANQSGLFSIMNSCNLSHMDFLKSYINKYPDLLIKIIIDSSMKSEAREMLDQNNISEKTLFPGLPGLCSWLRRYYGMAW